MNSMQSTTESRAIRPKVGIVTPSFNQAAFIGETIRSVLDQDYRDLDYWVIDGGSTDGTIDLLKSFETDPRFHWLSEKDRGQSDAVNKGWQRCQGEILGWVNSDDRYSDNTVVRRQVDCLVEHPGVSLTYGDCRHIDEQGQFLRFHPTKPGGLANLFGACYFAQPTVFIRRQLFDLVGPVNTKLHLALDYEYWLRCGLVTPFHYNPYVIADFRVHSTSKTTTLPYRHVRETLHAACANLANPRTREVLGLSRREEAWLLAGALLGAATWLIRVGDTRLAPHYCRRACTLSPFHRKWLFVWLAKLDQVLGTHCEGCFVDLLHFFRRWRYRIRF